MAVFAYIYFNNYVARSSATVAAVMSAALKLTPLQQVGHLGEGGGVAGGGVAAGMGALWALFACDSR
jgi:uncharacterized membrane protein